MISFRNKIWSLLNNGIEFALGIGLVAAITRMYSTEDTGAWFLFIAIFAMAGSLRDALIQSAMVKSTAGITGSSAHSSLKTNLTVMLSFELVTSLIIVAISFFLSTTLGKFMLFYPLYAVPNAWFRWQVFFLRSQLQIKEIFITNLLNLCTIIVLFVLLYLNKAEVIYLVPTMGAGSIAGGIFASFFLPYKQIIKSTTAKENLKLIRHFGFFAMLREATSAVSSRISLFYSSALLSLQQTAFLGVSQRFSQIALLPNNAFQSILFPSLVMHVNKGDLKAAKHTFEDSIAQLLAFTIPFALTGVFLSPFILELLSGPEYRQSWSILAIYLLLATIITPFGAAFGSMVTAMGKPQMAFRIVLVNSILNIGIGYLLMRNMGLMGAPLSMAITELGGFIWIGTILKKEADISIVSTFAKIPGIYVRSTGKVLGLLKKSETPLKATEVIK
ncbi:MAG: lipopolysaccharide biosynthesis protein [Imperialibacter sp.]|uniref:lipopolysaccharide biosynthesis protein n=1 Tax=Imperialibacter sp. TaxID=2038411 RepID=UPI003A8B31FC